MPDTLPQPATRTAIHPATRIGHVHLKVSDIQRALDFYCGVLGFELQQMYGKQAAFVSAVVTPSNSSRKRASGS